MDANSELDNSDVEDSGSWSDGASDISDRPRKKARRTVSHVQVPGPAFPRSVHAGWTTPEQLTPEMDALLSLKTAFNRQYASLNEQPECTYFALDDFSVYRPNNPRHASELATLDRLQNRDGFKELLFDGMLSVGNEKHYVRGVRFSTMAIDGYGDADVSSVDGRICIQSAQANRADAWFRLGKPSQEYRRFYDPFVWLAQFTKYFIDYLMAEENVGLVRFKQHFYSWLLVRNGSTLAILSWLGQCNLQDFRTSLAANVGFLWKECWSIDDDETGLCKHPLWGEIDPLRLTAIPKRENLESKTIVTPFVYDCFRQMYFHEHMEPRRITNSVTLDAVRNRKERLQLTPFAATQNCNADGYTPESLPDSAVDTTCDFMEGDVVCVPANSESGWRTSSSTWYAYVHEVRQESDRTALDVTWLYEPQDTTLGKAFYPFSNELFMSDNYDGGKHALDLSCVTKKAEVQFGIKNPASVTGLFVRQKFLTKHEEDSYNFVTLRKSDFNRPPAKDVPAFEECRRKYQIGDNVLVKEYNASIGEDVLQPAQIVDFGLETRRVILRRFRRQILVDPKCRPNEVTITEEIYSTAPSSVIRICQVRYFGHGDPVLPPYNRNGTGDFFFIRLESSSAVSEIAQGAHSQVDDDTVDAFDFVKGLPAIEEGLNPSVPPPFEKLRGMGIFCGGGNFDRGFEDSGVADFRWAIDWAEHALHSYRANACRPNEVQFFLGSVNDYLAQALSGSSSSYIALPGDVQLINAGSPCPGFSTLQPDKQSPDSLRNASMVASVVSYVDLYSPEYLVLENVVAMVQGMGANKDENVFAQVLASLVALGYQVQQFNMDAWSYGSSQSRSRVFVIASAPGLEPLLPPQHSHGHPEGKRFSQQSLGKSSNGRPFGLRRNEYTPFQHLCPADSTADLPNIADSQSQLCPAFPDHRTASDESSISRARIACVPVSPPGMGLAQAARQDRLCGEPLEYYNGLGHIRKNKHSKTYSRVHADGLFPTVVTAQRIACGVGGRTLHWSQHRPLTIMEMRRAQGFLDAEVIIGSTSQQVKIIGNSVDRNVSLVLGLALRHSWSRSNSDCLDGALPWRESSLSSAMPEKDSADCEPSSEYADLRLHLSQQEKEVLRVDPARGFRKIHEILKYKYT